MRKKIRTLTLATTVLSLTLTASVARAECPPYPQVAWWGKLTHEGVIRYVTLKHGGNWISYLEKWERQLAQVKLIHSQKKGIKTPGTGAIVKGEKLSEYIGKLTERVNINKCLAKENPDIKSTVDSQNESAKEADTVVARIPKTPYGQGILAYKDKDYEKAYNLWLPLATNGDPKAQNALGFLYRKGLGVEADIAKSRQWYTRSAAQGDFVGVYSLADIARETAQTQKEKTEVIRLMMKSAMQNYGRAQLALAEISLQGDGVKVSASEAYFWATLASVNKLKGAKEIIDKLDTELSEDIRQAQKKRAEEWLTRFQ